MSTTIVHHVSVVSICMNTQNGESLFVLVYTRNSVNDEEVLIEEDLYAISGFFSGFSVNTV